MRRIERFDKYMSFRGLNDNIVTKDLGLSVGVIGKSRHEGRDLSDRVIELILNFYTDLNRVWLLAGDGEMINASTAIALNSTQNVEEVEAEEVKATSSVPVVPSDIANTAEINVRKFIEKKGDELEHISPNDLVRRAEGAERVRKTSMMPTFMPGDVVFIEFLDDKTKIIDGHIYYFDTKIRPTMIRRVKFEGEKLRLIAENPMYGDIILTFDDILNIADIVGMFRSSFGNQYVEIEEVRKKKDSQIDKLIEHIGDLIAVVKDKS